MGDPALVVQAIEEGSAGLEIQFGVDPADVPVPDLTNPDPVLALEEILLFDIWVFQNAPRRGLIEVYSDPLTPAWKNLASAVEGMFGGVMQFVDDGGLAISEVRFATDEEELLIPAEVLTEAPAGSVALWYVYSADPFVLLDSNGEIREERNGWTDTNYLALVSPSARGWLLHWEDRQ